MVYSKLTIHIYKFVIYIYIYAIYIKYNLKIIFLLAKVVCI
jgi:hypothetical protein